MYKHQLSNTGYAYAYLIMTMHYDKILMYILSLLLTAQSTEFRLRYGYMLDCLLALQSYNGILMFQDDDIDVSHLTLNLNLNSFCIHNFLHVHSSAKNDDRMYLDVPLPPMSLHCPQFIRFRNEMKSSIITRCQYSYDVMLSRCKLPNFLLLIIIYFSGLDSITEKSYCWYSRWAFFYLNNSIAFFTPNRYICYSKCQFTTVLTCVVGTHITCIFNE